MLGDIGQSNDALAMKGRCKHGGRARLRESVEGFFGYTGHGVEHVRFAGFRIDHVVVERAEFCARDGGGEIGHFLDDGALIERRRQADTDLAQRS